MAKQVVTTTEASHLTSAQLLDLTIQSCNMPAISISGCVVWWFEMDLSRSSNMKYSLHMLLPVWSVE